MGEFAEQFAQGIAENLLGKNAAGFTRIMNNQRAARAGTTKPPANTDTPNRPPVIQGATGSQTATPARKGGRVAKSGRVKLHRGELVRARKTGRALARSISRR